MTNSKKRCTGCKDYFPSNDLILLPVGSYHSLDCAIEHAAKKRTAKINKKQKAYKKETTRLKRDHLANDRSHWMKKAQKACNAYIRKRDELEYCVSCGRFHNGQYHAGHYMPTSSHAELRFNEYNIFKQCMPCNTHKSGNLVNYRIELIDRIGLSHVEYLESSNTPYKYTLEDLKDIYHYYKEKLKELKTM